MIIVDDLYKYNFKNKKLLYNNEIYLVVNYYSYINHVNGDDIYCMGLRQITNNNKDYLFDRRNNTIYLPGNNKIKEFLSLCDLVD